MSFKSWVYDTFIADRYDAQLADLTAEFRQICVDGLNINEGDVVLDLGCGTALNQPYLAEKVGPSGRIIGIDASAKMLAHAKERAEQQGYADRLELIHGDLRDLRTLLEGKVDAVCATLIFSVVPDWKKVFQTSFDMLKPGKRYGIMDNYWPNAGLKLWLISWSFTADPYRRGFDPLEEAVFDFTLDFVPPDSDMQMYIAHGTKPTA